MDYVSSFSSVEFGKGKRTVGTFQNRIIKEMRLAGVCNVVGGNNFLDYYLPIFNNRFSIPPAEEGNMHRPVPKDIDLKSIFSIREERILRNNFTISYKTNLYQILK